MAEKLDVLVWGATSSVGRLVAEYFAKRYGKEIKWGIGGRSRAKLEAIRDELGLKDLPILTADAKDSSALDALVPQAKVIATTVGPYAIYGHELVAACARHGVDYCDLTGEVLFIRDTIDRHHETAVKSGARIVHCCGFDSIPSDLGAYMVNEKMREKSGSDCSEVKYFVTRMKGGVGGGTVASALYQFEAAKDPKARRILFNPCALNPTPADRCPDGPDSLDAKWDSDLRGWTGPFIMATVNTRIVRRSNALLGRSFHYSEAIGFPHGARGWARAQALSLGMKAALGALQLQKARSLAAKCLPPPGEGPSQAVREKGSFEIRLIGLGNGTKVEGKVRGTSDPGHGETSKMLAESALCLVEHRGPGGVLTPAVAMGPSLLTRLRNAGMEFQVQG